MAQKSSQQIVSDYFALQKRVTEQSVAKLTRIKNKAPKNLDNTVHALHNEVFEKIDCLDCANCCKTLGPGVKDADITRLAKHLKMRPSDVVQQYFTMDSDGDYIFNSMPCPFLMPDNYCMVYEARPRACREYPHTDRRRFEQLTRITKENLKVCPGVYLIIEALEV